MGMYSASKHAVKGFTDALRVEIEEVDKAPGLDHADPADRRGYALSRSTRKNYMDKEPKLPPPVIEPDQVAEAILKAATAGGGTSRLARWRW